MDRKMSIVSTTILSQYIDDIKIVRRIVNRSTQQLGVKTFSKMGTNVNGAIGSYTHFNLDDFITEQEKYILTARKDLKRDATELLTIAKRVQKDMR